MVDDFILKVDVIPDLFDYLGLLLSFIAIILSFIAIIRTIKESKTSFEIGIYSMIQDAKINLDNNIASIPFEERAKKTIEINAYSENFLNSLNMACTMYYSGAIRKKRFNKLYKSDIIQISRNPTFRALIYRKSFEYPHLRKYIEANTKD